MHVGPADARVGADTRQDLVDVGSGLLAQRGDLVRERQLERQERVGAVLDDLGCLDVNDEAGRLDAIVQSEDRRERVEIGIRKAPDDDPARVGEIIDCRPLAQELRVREHTCGRQPGRLDRSSRAADWEGAPDHEDVVRSEPVADRIERAIELR